MNPSENNDDALITAMQEAKKAFNETLEAYNYDPAYFSLTLEGTKLTSGDFKPYGHKILMKNTEVNENESSKNQ